MQIEPIYLPSGSARVYQLKSARFRGTCLAAQRPIATGDSPALVLRSDCNVRDETTHWAWQNASGAIRPALSHSIGGGLWGRIMCMAGVPWHSKDDWDMAPSMLNCDPESPSQRWSVDEQTGIVKNLGLGMCVQAVDGTPSFKVHGVPQSLNHPAPLSRSVLHPKADMRQSVHVPMLPEQKRLQLPVCLLFGCPLPVCAKTTPVHFRTGGNQLQASGVAPRAGQPRSGFSLTLQPAARSRRRW